MNSRFLSLLIAFAVLVNFSGIYGWAAEVNFTIANSQSVYLENVPLKSAAHSACAAHERRAAALQHRDHKTVKTGHVCGSVQCDCGCHMGALTFAGAGIVGALHATNLAMLQPQRVPLPLIKLSLRPPIFGKRAEILSA